MKKITKNITKTFKRTKQLGAIIKSKFLTHLKKLNKWAIKHPSTAFFGLLLILLTLIALSNFLQTPKNNKTEEVIIKKVKTFSIGSVPYRTFQAQVEKSGTITIYAQTSGIINHLPVKEGDTINAGKTLVSLASNYFGGNAATVQRQIAAKQYDQVTQTHGWQKEVIGKQREIALDTNTNADQLRSITAKSISETQDLINMYDVIVAELDNQLTATSSPSVALRSSKVQAQQALQGLSAALRNSEYQAKDSNPPTLLAQAQRDLTLKQLDIQEKGLDFSLEISGLQLKLAKINEALMYPAAPFTGVVNRVFVKKGQLVNHGQPLVAISSPTSLLKIVALVPAQIAKNISILEPSILTWDNEKIKMQPTHVSTDTAQNGLFAITFAIDQKLNNPPASNEYIKVSLPIGGIDSLASITFVPLTSVYQTESSHYVMVTKQNLAKAQQVELGRIDGGFVEIKTGLNSGDQVIMDRKVKTGDRVEIIH